VSTVNFAFKRFKASFELLTATASQKATFAFIFRIQAFAHVP